MKTKLKERNTLKTKLKTKFAKLYPGKRLLAIQLDGFTHSAIYDNGKKSDPVKSDRFSHCMPEGGWTAAARELFADIGNASYQGNAKEIIYLAPGDR